jgi:hypothetical protein
MTIISKKEEKAAVVTATATTEQDNIDNNNNHSNHNEEDKDQTAGLSSNKKPEDKRFLPSYKKPDAALTFPEKMMSMMKYSTGLADDPETFCIAWMPDGKSFIVRDPDEFTKKILPKFFKATKFSSFTRKCTWLLNIIIIMFCIVDLVVLTRSYSLFSFSSTTTFSVPVGVSSSQSRDWT